MMSTLDHSVQELGDGETILLDSGEITFKLDSFEHRHLAIIVYR